MATPSDSGPIPPGEAPDPSDPLSQLQPLLDRHAAGEPAARPELVEWLNRWYHPHVHAALHRFPAVRRWEETGDTLNDLLMRVDRALMAEKPETPARFLGLVAFILRRQLIDRLRHYKGAHGLGANHESGPGSDVGESPTGAGAAAVGAGPADRAEHADAVERLVRAMERLPDELREVLDLQYWHDLTLGRIAAVMGISLSTVNRRLVEARSTLGKLLREGA